MERKRSVGGLLRMRTWRFEPSTLLSARDRLFRRAGSRDLIALMTLFALSPAATGRLFGISRQAVNLWLERGVPPERLASVERVAGLANRLTQTFRKQRLPQIARTPMPGLGGRTILQTVAEDGIGPVDELVVRARSYVPVA